MLKQAPPPTDGIETPSRADKGILHRIYAFFYNKKVGLGLIGATGVLALIGALTRQMTDAVRLDPVLRADWLDQMRPIYGGWTDVAAFVGIFNIFSSPIFLVVCALLAVSIVCCTTHRLPLIYQSSCRPKTSARDSYFHRARYNTEFTSPLPVDETKAVIRNRLRKSRHRIIEDGDGETIFADRFHWAPFGTAVAHAGYVTVMAAFLVTSFFGFRNEAFDLTIGVPEEVGYGTGLTAEAVSFRDSYDQETGTPIDYVADLVLYRDGEQVARQDVRVNEPLIIDGVYFHQASFGVSAMVKVTDDSGKVLFDGGVPLVYRTPDESRQYGVAVLDDVDTEVFVIANASGGATPGLAAGQARVEVYPVDSQTPLGAATVDANDSTTIDGLTIEFQREQKFTTLLVKKDPGSLIVWLGSFLLIVGTMVTMGLRHRRQLIRVTPTEGGARVQMGSSDRAESMRERHFMTLADALNSDLNGTTRKEDLNA